MDLKKNIFEVLNERGICYAVGVSMLKLKSNTLDFLGKDYFIIIKGKDWDKLYGLTLRKVMAILLKEN